MVKKKDYFGATIIGTIWTIICLVISAGVWWLASTLFDNSIAPISLGVICFGIGIYQGRDSYKVELRTVRKDDPKTDWWAALGDMQILCRAMVFINGMNIMNDGFSWLGLGVLLCTLAFVLLSVYLRNTRFSK